MGVEIQLSTEGDESDIGQREVLERIASGSPLAPVLEAIVRLIEAQGDRLFCSILLIDHEHGCIRSGAAPSLPPAYTAAIDGAAIGPSAGSCGAAAFQGERVIVEDIATHPYWRAYKELALLYGLRACWSSPIFSPEREVLGTFAVYYLEPRGPSEHEIHWVDAATHLAAVAILRDRSEQSLRRSELRYRRLARLYAVSNGVNEAIVRLREPQQLYELACRIAVEQGLARMAWVGLCDPEDCIRPVAHSGQDEGYLDRVTLSMRDPRMNQGPAGRALRSGEYAICNGIATDPDFYWKDEAAAQGYQSCAVFPLKVAGRTIGTYSLYSECPDAFVDDEIRVLNALADDISFAVESAQNECERQRLVHDLRESEARLRIVIDGVADILFYLAVEPEGCYRFLSVNPAFLRTTGLTETEVVGRTVDELIPEPSRGIALARYADAIRTGEPTSWEEETPYPSGLKRGEVTVVPIFDDGGRCAHLVGTVHDITARTKAEEERRHLETQLHHSQRLQSLGTLAGGIAHDFNNILTAITGNIGLAMADLSDSATLRRHLTEINKASRRATALVRQILTFSRQQDPQSEIVNLPEIIEEALRLLRATLPVAIRVRTELLPNTPAVRADSSQVHQILMNLVTNAAHAMVERKGTIEILSDDVLIPSDSIPSPPDLNEGQYARVRVRDNGVGMDEATMARAFEPFFTTRRVGEGTGLGLSVVHGIMQAYGGAVVVDSELGKGTTFTLFFPSVEVPSHWAAPLSPLDSHHGNGEHVMFVDDEEALVFVGSRMLERLGYVVTGHSDPLQALQDFRRRPALFAAVVTDFTMPGISGPELARELYLIKPDVPILLTSGYLSAEDVEAANRAGVTHVVLKPCAAIDLGRHLYEVLHTQHPFSPRV